MIGDGTSGRPNGRSGTRPGYQLRTALRGPLRRQPEAHLVGPPSGRTEGKRREHDRRSLAVLRDAPLASSCGDRNATASTSTAVLFDRPRRSPFLPGKHTMPRTTTTATRRASARRTATTNATPARRGRPPRNAAPATPAKAKTERVSRPKLAPLPSMTRFPRETGVKLSGTVTLDYLRRLLRGIGARLDDASVVEFGTDVITVTPPKK